MEPSQVPAARCTTPVGMLLAAAVRWFNPLAMTTGVLLECGQIGSVASTPNTCDNPVRGPRQGALSGVEHGTGISHDTRSTAERSDAPTLHLDCTGGRNTTEHPSNG